MEFAFHWPIAGIFVEIIMKTKIKNENELNE